MQRGILFLSITLIVLAITGIVIFTPKAKPQAPVVAPVKVEKKSLEYAVAADEIYAGSKINEQNINFSSIQYEGELNQGLKNLLSKSELLSHNNYAAIKNIKAGEKISKDMLIDINSPEYAKLKLSPTKGFLSFAFTLEQRQASLLEEIGTGDYVDVFFRYETKNPKKDDGIAPKRRKDGDYRNYETANTTTLMPLFINKKVLFKQHIKVDEKQTHSPKEREVGQIFIQLSPDEAKRVYAIENLGNFFIFPAQEQNKTISTEKVLQKEFIKELRGGSDAQ